MKLDTGPETSQMPASAVEPDAASHLGEAEIRRQLKRQFKGVPFSGERDGCVAPIGAAGCSSGGRCEAANPGGDAEAASQAVSAERRLSFEQWEQKFAAGRAEIQNETAQAIEKFQHEADEHSRTAHAEAAEALRTELPRWLAPQLEQLTRDLTANLSREGAASATNMRNNWKA